MKMAQKAVFNINMNGRLRDEYVNCRLDRLGQF